MGSTYLSLQYHLVFSTKNRASIIAKEWRPNLLQYLGGIISGLKGVAIATGGVEDHVHLLVGLRATHCLADVMRDLKRDSSIWVHDTLRIPTFAWQEGYAAFTVSASAITGVRNYIANQEDHHSNLSSRDELLTMLNKAEIEYDPKYFE